MSSSTHNDPYIGIQKYDSNWSCQTNLFDHAATTCVVIEPERLKVFKCYKVIHAATFELEPLKAFCLESSAVPSLSNSSRTDAAKEGGRQDINDLLFGPQGSRYLGVNKSFPCDPEDPCSCEHYSCPGTHSTIRYIAAAATTAKSLGIALSVTVLQIPTPSEIDQFYWHCLICFIHCHVKITTMPRGPCFLSGHGEQHSAYHRCEERCRIRGTKRGVLPNTKGIDKSGTILTAHLGCTEGVQPPT